MEILITGASGIIGNKLLDIRGAIPCNHDDCDLTDWESVKSFEWEGDTIVHCANYGRYKKVLPNIVEKNIAMLTNLRRRYPKAKVISFGSGAMYDKNKPIVKVGEYDPPVYPKDDYGLAKRITVDMSDVTLIPFGLFADTRFIAVVKDCIKRDIAVPIYQDVKFSWVDINNLPKIVEWAIKKGKGRYNLCEFDMTLTEIAKKLDATKFTYLKRGKGYEYTGTSRIR